MPIFSTTVSALSEERLREFAQNEIEFYDPEVCADGSNGNATSTISNVSQISGTTAEEKVWSGLKSMGLSDEVTAGIMGNMSGESGFNPARYEDAYKSEYDSYDWENDASRSMGVGLIQWSFQRRVDLFKYLRQSDSDLTDKYLKDPSTYGGLSGDDFIKKADSEAEADTIFSLELTYLMDEIKSNSKYAEVLSQTTVADAAEVFATNVEGCATCTPGSANTEHRRDKAQEFYQNYHGKTSFGQSTTGGSSTAITGSQVTVIGDSITNSSFTRSAYNSKLSGVDITAEDGKHFSMSGGSGGTPGLTILENLVSENKLRSVLVFALGTNDTVSQSDIDKLLQTASQASKIVLVTNYDNGVMEENNQLFNAAASQDSRVVVADWANLVKDNASQYLGDGTHPKDQAAGDAYVDLIVQTIGAGVSNSSSGGSSDEICCDPGATPASDGAYAGTKYALSDEQVRRIAAMAANENGGSVSAIKTEASIMANLFERNRGPAGDVNGLISYLTSGGWFAGSSVSAYNNGADYANQEYIDAVRDVLVNGNRTIPTQVVEHDCTGDLEWLIDGNGQQHNNDVAGNCAGTALNDKNLYVRGKTKVHNAYGSTWIFWDWADPENKSGDPFGYFEDNPPSNSTVQSSKGTTATTVSGSSVVWQDGWIESGIDGYVRDEITNASDGNFGADYVTDAINGEGKGPNKITLHTVEGPGSGADSVKYVYESSGTPPHFTIDIRNKKLYQHTSILTASAAIKGGEYGDLAAGVQIEIFGYDNTYEMPTSQSDWYLDSDENFSDADWQYLAELLNAISVETGIPLSTSVDWEKSDDSIRLDGSAFQSYQGILGHKHTPLPNDHTDPEAAGIWKRIEKALANFTGAQQSMVCAGTPDVASLQSLAADWTWKQGETNWGTTTRKDAYTQVIEQRKSAGKYIGGGIPDGVDCGGFVTSLIQESGWDPNYNTSPGGDTSAQLQYLVKTPKWKEVTSSINSNSDAQPGDVLITEGKGHTLIYVGQLPGYSHSPMVSASLSERAPMEDASPNIMSYKSQGYRIFRNTEPPMTNGSGAIGEGGLTYEQAKKFMINYGANKNESSSKQVGALWGMCNGGGSNCVTFSAFFLNKFTQTNVGTTPGNGYEVVGNLGARGVKTGSEPRVWSVFSYGTSTQGKNHTGVILGYQDGQWIVGQAGCSNSGRGAGDGTSAGGGSGVAVMSSDLVYATWGAPSLDSISYAYLEDQVDTSAIMRYIETGE